MTDKEIIKALEYCKDCSANLNVEIIDLINRLQAENNTLKYQVNRLKKYDERRDIVLHSRLITEAKAEARKEFAERLNEKLCDCHIVSDGEYCGFDCSDVHECVDSLLKEMVGEEND